MGADGSAQTPITSFNGDELYPVWSPDGARIAFQQDSGLHPERIGFAGLFTGVRRRVILRSSATEF